MTYYIGDKLDNRIKQYGLQDLYTLLAQIKTGEASWPGTCSISASPEHLEPIRVTLYSVLHQVGLKQQFRIKMKDSQLTLEQRSAQNNTQVQFTRPEPETVFD